MKRCFSHWFLQDPQNSSHSWWFCRPLLDHRFTFNKHGEAAVITIVQNFFWTREVIIFFWGGHLKLPMNNCETDRFWILLTAKSQKKRKLKDFQANKSSMGKKNCDSNKWTDKQKKKWGQRKHGRHRLHYQTWTSYSFRQSQKKSA